MPFELTATTEPGQRLVALAEQLAEQVGRHASQHDREASFPFEGLAVIKRSGYLAAPVPKELGGLGVTSLHDVLVGSSRLARGDAALTIGVNMHLVFLINVVRLWQVMTVSGDERRAAAFAATIEQVARDGTVFASAVSEPQQDLTRPATTATRTETGWRISGRKIFSTMSAAADVFYTAVTYSEDSGAERYGYAMVPRETPGVVVHEDWDGMGMRASGSHSVTFEDVHVPAATLRGGFPTGDTAGYLERNLSAGLFHAAAAVGIAESAHTTAVSRLAGGTTLEAHAQMLVAENIVDLSACRAVLSHAAQLIDGHYALHRTSRGTGDELTKLFGEAQSAKLFVGDAAVRIVDRALSISGGAGYLNGNPLARAYRDVRALPFMHPLGANRGYAFLGQLGAGREPSLH
jgi:alkylation response protein AidB-like acyl-CoA dehydrogenase